MPQTQISAEGNTAAVESEAISLHGFGTARRRRRWMQFSLRAFLALATLVSIGFGWLGIQIDHARRQRTAIETLNASRVRYSYEPIIIDREYNSWPAWEDALPPTPAFVRRIFGENIFADAVYLSAFPSDLSQLGSLQTLQWLSLTGCLNHPDFTNADLVHVGKLTRLKGLDLRGTAVTDAGLRHLAGLAELEVLEVSSVAVNGTGLSYLSHCTRLNELVLYYVPMSEEGARYIAALGNLEGLSVACSSQHGTPGAVGDSILESCENLRRLRYLDLIGTSVTGAGLRHLRGIANLETLLLDHAQVSGDDLETLSTLPALTSLRLSETPISNADLGHIARLTNLTLLDLSGPTITDAGLAQLSTLGKLEDLYLDHGNISDGGIMHLCALKNLERLFVQDTRVTKHGVEQLQLALPNVRIRYD